MQGIDWAMLTISMHHFISMQIVRSPTLKCSINAVDLVNVLLNVAVHAIVVGMVIDLPGDSDLVNKRSISIIRKSIQDNHILIIVPLSLLLLLLLPQ